MAKSRVRNSFVRERLFTDVVGDSRTKQSFAAECDVNLIMRRFQATGLISHVKEASNIYADVSSGFDYHTALNQMQIVQGAFFKLPSNIRAAFSNDAGLFFDFVNNPANHDEMIKMGLKTDDKPVDKSVDKPVDKSVDKPVDKPVES